MPMVRKMILNQVVSDLYNKMCRRKKLEGDLLKTPMRRCLSTFDITLLGVGHMVGTGIYVLTGTVARDMAGPGVILSFLIAGFASFLSALCYAEMASLIPKAGSAYVYTYVSVNEVCAFFVGWSLILEHMIGAVSVAKTWSGYVDSLVGGAISNYTRDVMDKWTTGESLGTPDVLASGLCLFYAMFLGLGVKASATVNSLLTIINLTVMSLVVALGIYYADIANWGDHVGGFLPYRFSGVIMGAATCFYAYIGFDSIAISGEEARDPGRSIPLATMISMGIVTVGYMLMSAALTLVVPFYEINPTAALPEAFSSRGVPWAKYVISVGALCGMTTTLFGSLFSLPRTMYSMANDGLLFSFFGHINERTQMPIYNLIISGLLSAMIALLCDLQLLVEFMSIGTLFAYILVAISVIQLRYPFDIKSSDQSSVCSPSSDCSSPPTEEADSSIASTKSELCEGSSNFKPGYTWMEIWLENYNTRCVIIVCLLIYVATCSVFSYFVVTFELETGFFPYGKPSFLCIASMLMFPIGSLFVISAYKQNPPTGKFQIPLMPLLPGLSIFFNIHLMMHLSTTTWTRFFVWMIFGIIIYLLCAIHYNKETAATPNSCSVLMATTEAEKGTKWGSTLQDSPKNDKARILSEFVD